MTTDALPVEHLFTLTADVARAATIAGGPVGTRVIVGCSGGTFEGLEVEGVVDGPGGDWVQSEQTARCDSTSVCCSGPTTVPTS